MCSKKIIIVILFSFLFSGCKKDKIVFNPVPVIESININPAIAIEYSDDVILSITYRDGDGDLGENKEGVKNCFVTDDRLGITSSYRIQQLAPLGESIPISGTLNIDLGRMIITDSSAQQQFSLRVKITDRQGNESNSMSTNIIVRKN